MGPGPVDDTRFVGYRRRLIEEIRARGVDDLETLRAGDEVQVHSHRGAGDERRDRTETYVVEDVEVYRKGALARQAAELFSQEVDGRLVLLTCEDWDGTRYLSNVVVTALPVADDGGTARG